MQGVPFRKRWWDSIGTGPGALSFLSGWVVVLGTIAAVWKPGRDGWVAAEAPRTQPARVSIDEQVVRELIARLGDPSYGVRTDALRDLMAIGPDVLPLLREAARGTDAEIALRARSAVAMFDQVLLAGAKISIEADPDEVAWDEPFALKVRISNQSEEPCRTPFGPDVERKQDGAGPERQVAAMMDLADYITVTAPDGRSIPLHCDDIDEDLGIRQTVAARAERFPYGLLGGGETRELALDSFNRGWARYRMLAPGRYSMRVSYQPEWKDEELIRRGVGMVESEPVYVTVTESAGRALCEAERPLVGEVALENGAWVARLVNLFDRRVLVNTNWGDDISRRARVTWLRRRANHEMVEFLQPRDREAFDLQRFVALEPLERVEVARVTARELAEALGTDGESQAEPKPGFLYLNMLSRGALRRKVFINPDSEPDWQALYGQLPPFVFSGSVTAPPE